ncbi:MAG TPA: zinc-finger domain-containing protein [Usitatibacter sp.]|nr:zinc-finger domain-containing protein [Usitatibacter sp.]
MPLPSELDRKFVEVSAADLPLHCPLPSQKLWNTHPRVFLPIDVQKECRCPYCGTLYKLVGEAKAGH